jgi:hypothetical protein
MRACTFKSDDKGDVAAAARVNLFKFCEQAPNFLSCFLVPVTCGHGQLQRGTGRTRARCAKKGSMPFQPHVARPSHMATDARAKTKAFSLDIGLALLHRNDFMTLVSAIAIAFLNRGTSE